MQCGLRLVADWCHVDRRYPKTQWCNKVACTSLKLLHSSHPQMHSIELWSTFLPRKKYGNHLISLPLIHGLTNGLCKVTCVKHRLYKCEGEVRLHFSLKLSL